MTAVAQRRLTARRLGTRRRFSPVGVVAGAALVAAILAAIGYALWPSGGPEAAKPNLSGERVSAEVFAERTGVRLVRVALVGGSGMLDVRYQVIDPDRAILIHESAKAPGLIADGQLLDRPFGHGGHPDKLVAGRTYFLLLVNLGNAVERGDEVSVRFSGLILDRVPVQ